MDTATLATPGQSLARPAGIVFDWDNTLVDTFPVIHDALNATFRAFGKPEWTYEESLARVRQSMRDSFPQLFGARWEEAGKTFYAHYDRIHMAKLAPLKGAEDLLNTVRRAGIYMGVVSNKNGSYLRTEAEALGWSGFFGRMVGSLDAPRDKPSPEPVELALASGEMTPGPDIWFIGDADTDMECALNTGCVPILLRQEPPAPGEFEGCEPALHVGDCEALCKFVNNL